jgi:hypothetical protein
MCTGFQLPFAADPEIGFAAAAETGGWLSGLLSGHLHDQSVAERRQRPFIKGLGAGVVRHRKSHVIDHVALLDRQRARDDRAAGFDEVGRAPPGRNGEATAPIAGGSLLRVHLGGDEGMVALSDMEMPGHQG